jgi:solute carrier family 39 (zinc transporter), member 7
MRPLILNNQTSNTNVSGRKTGGLLSDVFLHLIPHSFMGEHQDPGVHVIVVDGKRNILIGCVRLFAPCFVCQ